MTFRPAATALLASVLVPSVAWANDSIGPGAITASVRDAAGNPVAGAFVDALGPTERHATTTVAGIVTLAALPYGSYRVRIVATGYETSETVATLGGAHGFTLLRVRLERTAAGTSPTNLASAPAMVALEPNDPSLVHPLASAPEVYGANAVLATTPVETAVTLDGLPLEGPSSGPNALRPDALAVDRIAILPGSETIAPVLDGAVGGALDLRTSTAFQPRNALASAGYDSTFGSFQRVDGAASEGRLGASLTAVVGGGLERDTLVHLHDALSGATSLDVDSYDLERATSPLSNAAHDGLGDVRLQTRALGSNLVVRAYSSAYDGLVASDRTRGYSAGLQRGFGTSTLDLTYDDHTDDVASNAGGVRLGLSSLTGLLGVPLEAGGRLAFGDQFAVGTAMPATWLPRVALSLPAGSTVTLHASAGGSYVTAPFELTSLQPSAATLAPETSFAYSGGLDFALNGGGTLSLGSFAVKRWNTFATYADARSSGVEVGYSRQPLAAGLGIDAGLSVARDVAYGSLQPADRVVTTFLPGTFDADGTARARLGLTYGLAGGLQFHAAALDLGPDNGFTDRALHYSEVGVSVPFLRAFALHLDAATPLGTAAPRTFSLSLGAASPSRQAPGVGSTPK